MLLARYYRNYIDDDYDDDNDVDLLYDDDDISMWISMIIMHVVALLDPNWF